MRFSRFLNEKFIDGVKVYRHDYEIFKNPTRKELKELDAGFGYRFIIDAKNKNIYFANSELFHRDILKSTVVSHETNFSFGRWSKYWNGTDEAISRIFMGDCASDMGEINSDVFSEFISHSYTEVTPKLEVLLGYDYNWVSKYGMNPHDIKKEISNCIEILGKKL